MRIVVEGCYFWLRVNFLSGLLFFLFVQSTKHFRGQFDYIAVITNENICKCQINVAKTNYQKFSSSVEIWIQISCWPKKAKSCFQQLRLEVFLFLLLLFCLNDIYVTRTKNGFLKIFLHNMHFNLMLLRTNLNPFLFASLCIAQ